ncbi:PREDICTED: uncharacterized protein LOC104723895 [Camelina sativa]|uniref:Uncharacterized protein LOC104723895 n=1 Tax=Camelina sativa TaxID=90675 RepID=A0ABM0UG32_CAMSA|nr:PREDICTED: uncharacterized protein LOC104723895 [Camelina sativa]XP_019088798.1 PREDICTED: uncharacterized protein LOC104723895 [Camelina sativa]
MPFYGPNSQGGCRVGGFSSGRGGAHRGGGHGGGGNRGNVVAVVGNIAGGIRDFVSQATFLKDSSLILEEDEEIEEQHRKALEEFPSDFA